MQVLEEFDKENLQTIVLSKNQFNNFKVDDHEIKFKGKLYDIVISKFKNNKFELTVFHDKEEEYVLKEIAFFFKYRCKSNQKLPLKANQLSLSNYIVSNCGCINFNFNFAFSTLLNKFLKLGLINPYASIFLPPPR